MWDGSAGHRSLGRLGHGPREQHIGVVVLGMSNARGYGWMRIGGVPSGAISYLYFKRENQGPSLPRLRYHRQCKIIGGFFLLLYILRIIHHVLDMVDACPEEFHWREVLVRPTKHKYQAPPVTGCWMANRRCCIRFEENGWQHQLENAELLVCDPRSSAKSTHPPWASMPVDDVLSPIL
jgi:hypothetical protein